MRALGIAVHCSAHLQMGVLTGIVAINADLEIGASMSTATVKRLLRCS